MRFYTHLLFSLSLLISQSVLARTEPESGSWIGKLELNTTTDLPFRMVFNKTKTNTSIIIRNGEEQINLMFNHFIGDTLVYSFPEFDSDLYLLVTSIKTITGYWHNKNKKGKYIIPLSAHHCQELLFECHAKKTNNLKLERKWKTEFSPNSDDMFPAIGLFTQKDSLLTGTFLTETGDYRFLVGNFFGDKLYLSCFDGSHAFLFKADLKDDTLKGVFYSGNHYSTTWIASANENYELSDPNELTYIVNDDKLVFDFNTIHNKPFHYPNLDYQNKVTIIQIMGSWCPNCMDETRYFIDLHKKYHDAGLEIILIGYESGANEEEYRYKLNRLQSRHNIPFTMLVGGAANKNKAAEDFSMLNHIISFPTSIFIDRKGNIAKVYTGFSGPSTGQYYTEYMLHTEKFIQELLKN
jgi:thiol-disulfide isomerase/thioredoxin